MTLVRSIFVPILKLDVQGLGNLPPEGAAILVANHVTNFDVFPMQFALPRVIFFMGKAKALIWRKAGLLSKRLM